MSSSSLLTDQNPGSGKDCIQVNPPYKNHRGQVRRVLPLLDQIWGLVSILHGACRTPIQNGTALSQGQSELGSGANGHASHYQFNTSPP